MKTETLLPDKKSLSTKESKQRIVGYDVARALAVFGMVIVNFKVVMGADGNGPGWLIWLTGLLEGRAAATFVILAGVGVSLLSRRALLAGDHEGLIQNRNMLLKRALFLFVAGLLYTPLWPADILHFYGVYIAVCAFALGVSNRLLWTLAFAFMLAFVVLMLSLDYEKGWNWETLDYHGFRTLTGMIRHIFFNGFHPVFPWTAFMLAGLWLGRQDMTNPRFRGRLLLISASVVALAEGASAYLIHTFGGASFSAQHEVAEFILGSGPMPPMPFYLLSAGGTAVIVITLCVIVSEKFAEAKWLKPFIATGQLALTNYVAHVVIGMGTLGALGLLYRQTLPFAMGCAFIFCLAAILFSHYWLKRFKRGPLEWVMRRITG